MSEFALPLPPRDQEWIELRDRLARTARDMHFFAVTGDAVNGATLLVMAGYFAELAMSIPLRPAGGTPTGMVHPLSLIATQVLQHDPPTGGEAAFMPESARQRPHNPILPRNGA